MRRVARTRTLEVASVAGGAFQTRLERRVRAHWVDNVPRSAIRKHWESPKGSELVDNVWEHHLREEPERALQGLPDVEAEDLLEEPCDYSERCFEELYGEQPKQLLIGPTKLTAAGAQVLHELLETEESVAQVLKRFSDGEQHVAFEFLLADEVDEVRKPLAKAGVAFTLQPFLPKQG